MSTPVYDSEWLEKQLPSSIVWGHAPLQISMKGAPPNVKAASIRLERVDSKDPPTVQHALPAAVVNKPDGEPAALVVPKKPDGPIMPGTYRIAWSITYTDGSKVQHGSKSYDGLASFYGDDKKALEKEAYTRALAESEADKRKKGSRY